MESEASHINVGTGRDAVTPTKLIGSRALLRPANSPYALERKQKPQNEKEKGKEKEKETKEKSK